MAFEIIEINHTETVTVSSLDIAQAFEKNHRDVLKAIRELKCSEEFRLRNFAQSTYINEQNREQPMYLVTRDGFSLLAMSFTGEKATQFKIAYIDSLTLWKRHYKISVLSAKRELPSEMPLREHYRLLRKMNVCTVTPIQTTQTLFIKQSLANPQSRCEQN